MSYIELHACSAFSFLRGGSFPEQLAEVALELEMPAMALLDRNGVYGAQRFSVAAREHGVRPIVGAELSMEGGSILPVLVNASLANCRASVSDANPSRRFTETPHKLIDVFGRGNVFVELQRHFIRG